MPGLADQLSSKYISYQTDSHGKYVFFYIFMYNLMYLSIEELDLYLLIVMH